MTYGRILPEMPCVRPDPLPRRRKDATGPSHYTDAQVIDAVLCHLAGEACANIAVRLGCGLSTVTQWTNGITRTRCYREALTRWRKQLTITKVCLHSTLPPRIPR